MREFFAKARLLDDPSCDRVDIAHQDTGSNRSDGGFLRIENRLIDLSELGCRLTSDNDACEIAQVKIFLGTPIDQNKRVFANLFPELF